MNWKCDKCGSEEVQQEYAFMRPMNNKNDSDYLDDAINAWQNDFYWCVDCDEECDPIRDKE